MVFASIISVIFDKCKWIEYKRRWIEKIKNSKIINKENIQK
jgi:hypothetical protein